MFNLQDSKKSGIADVATYVTNVTSATAKCILQIKHDYGNLVTEKGFCWSTTMFPTLENNHIAISDTVAILNNLTENTTYYIRSYAINAKGTSYGRQLTFTTKNIASAEGRLPKGFLVNDSTEVYFSQGNLQYQATTNTWKFASAQTTMIGEQNAQTSASYDGWIDLFGWGTSGFATSPYETSLTYTIYGDGNKDIANTKYDWGVFCHIDNAVNGNWRTLTNSEWEYLLQKRPNAENLRGMANVRGVNGLVLLPDNWQIPDNCSFSATAISYNINKYDEATWNAIQNAGAVFLPAGGNRYNTTINDCGIEGFYWTSTTSGEYSAYSISFTNGIVSNDCSYRIYGRSVRLVQDIQ